MQVPIFDTHQHLWDLRELRLPWVDSNPPLNRNFLLADYAAATAGYNIAKTLYMEVDVDPADLDKEAVSVLALCNSPSNPMGGAIIGCRPADPDFPTYTEKWSQFPEIRGMRQVLHAGAPTGFCTTPDFVNGVQLLGQLGLTFDICIKPSELAYAAALADLCPHTQFILDHCGNADITWQDTSKERAIWLSGIEDIAKRSNVACKISGIVVTAKDAAWKSVDLSPYVEKCVEAFGIDRVLFGGDWPVCTLQASLSRWIDALAEITSGWTIEDQHRIWHENGERIYGV